MVEYVYDAWGNHKIFDVHGVELNDEDNIGYINPFRYRSYYYDVEFDLYYLKTRYYSPALCRFINADSVDYADPETINGLNLYAYCGNNPVMFTDSNGTTKWWDVLAWIGVALFAAALTVVTLGAAGIAVGGIAGGIIMGASIGTLFVGVIGAGIGAVGGMIYDAAMGNKFGTSIGTWAKAGFGIGAIAGAVIGAAIGWAAGASISGLSNASVWTGLGKEGASIAAKEAASRGLTTLGETFGGKVISAISHIIPKGLSNQLWIWASKLMVSTINMTSIQLFSSVMITTTSVFAAYELPILIDRGIYIIKVIIGG